MVMSPLSLREKGNRALPTMQKEVGTALWALVALLLASSGAGLLADEPTTPPALDITVELIDGTVLQGTSVTLIDGKLEMKTPILEKISIDLEKVHRLTARNDQILDTTGGQRFVGRLHTEPGNIIWVIETERGEEIIEKILVKSLNAPDPRPEQQANIALAGANTSGNSNTTSITFNLDYRYRFEEHRVTASGDWIYGEEEMALSKRNTGGSLKYDWFTAKDVYLYSGITLRGDSFADLRLRTTVGSGGGIQIIEEKDLSWSQEAGVSYLSEDFILAVDQSTATLRIAGSVDWQLFDGNLDIHHEHTAFLGFDNPDDVLLETRNGIRYHLLGNVSATLQLNYRYDTEPPPDIEKGDLELSVGLGYSMKF